MGIHVIGHGHCVGDVVVENRECDAALGLEAGWLEARTGIRTRRICSGTQSVTTMAVEAIEAACKEARLESSWVGPETALLHIQNGVAQVTPPGVIQVARELGFAHVRTVGIDGVCAEPIAALELADLLISSGRCDRAIISASADFVDFVDRTDRDTVGLFGAGAGAVIVERAPASSSQLKALSWATFAEYSTAGEIDILGRRQQADKVNVDVGYYKMDGTQLARVALRIVPEQVFGVLDGAGWTVTDVSHVVAHQPNTKLLELGMRKLGFDPGIASMPVRQLGNMGPASLLVALSQAFEHSLIGAGSRVLLVAFGLGFSVGVAALEL